MESSVEAQHGRYGRNRAARASRAWQVTVLAVLVTLAAGRAICWSSGGRCSILAVPWPEADALFRQDARWLGADGAYSVDLGGGRVLWLFGDSFIATSPSRARRDAAFIHNSVAIQQGYDPSQARMRFYWGNERGAPASFFGESGAVWKWPGHGIRTGDSLIVFLMRLRTSRGALGFESDGWEAVAVDGPDQEPTQWRMRPLATPRSTYGVVVGSASVVRMGEDLYAMGCRESEGHAMVLCRWPMDEVKRGDLSRPRWWTGEGSAWVPQDRLTGPPCPVFRNGATELTVHFEPRLGEWLEVQTDGFGAAELGCRRARRLTGPWSPLEHFHRPAESARKDVLVYAGKAHPELLGADLVMTYVANSLDPETVLRDPHLYYPRFLRGTLQKRDALERPPTREERTLAPMPARPFSTTMPERP